MKRDESPVMCLEQQLSSNQLPAVFLDSWAATKAEKACSAIISDEVARLAEEFDETPAILQNSVEFLGRHLSNVESQVSGQAQILAKTLRC